MLDDQGTLQGSGTVEATPASTASASEQGFVIGDVTCPTCGLLHRKERADQGCPNNNCPEHK